VYACYSRRADQCNSGVPTEFFRSLLEQTQSKANAKAGLLLARAGGLNLSNLPPNLARKFGMAAERTPRGLAGRDLRLNLKDFVLNFV
jgi:hypothetical protein